jgi:F-type H+-transporting ATPase subunit alpha
MVDARTRKTIEHGRRIRAVLSQPQYRPRSLAVQVTLLLALSEGLLDPLEPERLGELAGKLSDWIAEHAAAPAQRVDATGELDDDSRSALLAASKELIATIGAP